MRGRIAFDADARRRLRTAWGDGVGAPPASARRWRLGGAAFPAILAIGLHAAASRGSLPPAAGVAVVQQPGPDAFGRIEGEVDVRRSLKVVATLAGAALSVASAEAADRRVPEDYPTIESALAAAADGDVVSIAPGEYWVGTLVVPPRAIVIEGRGPREQTVLRGTELRFDAAGASRELRSLVLRDFTGYGALTIDRSAVQLASVDIIAADQAAVFLNHYATLTMVDCIVRDCGRGGGGYVGCTWNATDCRFIDNGYSKSYGGAVGFHIGSNANFLRCDFIRNSASTGGAIGLSFGGSRIFDGCYFEGNTASVGPVWWTEYGATGTLRNSVLCGHGPGDLSGSWIDGGGNSFFPKGCEPPCPADLVVDGVVNAVDLALVLSNWGTDGSGYEGVDLDGSGVVDAIDLATVLSEWGPCPTG